MCRFNGLSQKDKNGLHRIVKAKIMGVQLSGLVSLWSGEQKEKASLDVLTASSPCILN